MTFWNTPAFVAIILWTSGGYSQDQKFLPEHMTWPVPDFLVTEREPGTSDIKLETFSEDDDREKMIMVPASGGGMVYQIEVDGPVDFDGITGTTTTGNLTNDADAITQSEQRDIVKLQALVSKLYQKRFTVTDSNDSKGLRKAAARDYVNVVYQARKILCPYSNCNYGVCFMKDVDDIRELQLDEAVASLNADWTYRVENPNAAFTSQASNVIVQRNTAINTAQHLCTSTGNGVSICFDNAFPGTWNPYVYTAKDIAFIKLVNTQLGNILPTKKHLQNIAVMLTACACYKGFHGVNCEHCVCSDTPGIYDHPVNVNIAEKNLAQ